MVQNNIGKIRKYKEDKKVIEDIEKECPNCHTINDAEAKFCSQCGYNFISEGRCPKCGAKIISSNADICEACGEWLLDGKCRFCYAELEEGAKFCSECGNPVEGIVCPNCGMLNHFDFCTNCSTPLTNRAKKMIEKIKNSPQEQPKTFSTNQEARAFYMAQMYLNLQQHIKKTDKLDEQDELTKLNRYIEKSEGSKKKTLAPLFSEKQKQNVRESMKMAEDEIEKQKERRKLEKRKRPKGWLCNAYHYLHPGGPHECADPSKGGRWIY